MKLIVLAASLGLLAAASARADIVFLNDGSELSGKVLKADAGGVVLRAGGKDATYPTAQVMKVKLVRVYNVPGEEKASDVKDPELKALLAAPPRPSDYPDDGYLTWLDEKACDLGEDGRATCTRRVVRLVLRERDKEKAANVQFYFLGGQETGAIDWARAINGEKVSGLDDTSVEEGSEYSQYPAYDRLKSLKFAVPDVATGTVIDYQYRVVSELGVATQPFKASMRFRDFEPAVNQRFVVTAPKDMALDVAEVGLPKDAAARVEDVGGAVRRTWEVHGVPSFKQEDDMPPTPRIAPFVEVAEAATWPEVARAAARAIEPRLAAGPAVAAQAAELVKGKEGDGAKVEALYDWVARAIKYQDVTMGSYSYVPKGPDEVYAAKAGDALDKPFLLFVMLRAAGFKPQLAYLQDKGGLPFERAVPTLGQFSAAAVVLDLGTRRLVMTPLEDTRRLEETPEWLQGVHGLVVYGPDQGLTLENPLREAAAEGETDRMTLSLAADGSLSGSATLLPAGEDEASWRAMKDWKKADIDHEFEQIVHGIHPQARLTGYSVEGLDDPARALEAHLKFTIEDYALTASGGYMAFQLPWVEDSAGNVSAPSREQPMFWWRRSGARKVVSVDLPRGWGLYYAPPPAKLEGPGETFDASYAPAPGKLDYSSESTRDAVEVSPLDYPKYKEFREAAVRYSKRWIVVKKESARAVN